MVIHLLLYKLTRDKGYGGQLKGIQEREIVRKSVGRARPLPEYPEEYKALPVKGKSCALSSAYSDLTRHASCKRREPQHCLIARVAGKCPSRTFGPSIPFNSINTIFDTIETEVRTFARIRLKLIQLSRIHSSDYERVNQQQQSWVLLTW